MFISKIFVTILFEAKLLKMKTLVVLLLLSIAGTACYGRRYGRSRRETPDVADMLPPKVYSKIDECKELHQMNAANNFVNCSDEAQDCLQSARTLSQNCLAKEAQQWMKLDGMADCLKDNREDIMAWFKAVCKASLYATKCMTGETVPDIFKVTHNHHQHGARPQYFPKHFKADCWTGALTKQAECGAKALELCDNFKYCTGLESPVEDHRLQEWHDVVHHNTHEMWRKTKVATDIINECLVLERKKEIAEDVESFLFF